MNHYSLCKLALPVFLAAMLGILPATAQEALRGDPEKGKELAETVCHICHNVDGNSPKDTKDHPNLNGAISPLIAGQMQEYVVKQLRQFKSRERVDSFMNIYATVLATEADERNVAAWYEKQTMKPAAATDESLIARGQGLWRGGDLKKGIPACSGCHGASGKGVPSQYPALAGQYPEYLALQLNKFRTGERTNDPENMMRDIAEKLTDHDIKAVAEYAAGLR